MNAQFTWSAMFVDNDLKVLRNKDDAILERTGRTYISRLKILNVFYVANYLAENTTWSDITVTN